MTTSTVKMQAPEGYPTFIVLALSTPSGNPYIIPESNQIDVDPRDVDFLTGLGFVSVQWPELPFAGSLIGDEIIQVNQGGIQVQSTVREVASVPPGGRPPNADLLSGSISGTLDSVSVGDNLTFYNGILSAPAALLISNGGTSSQVYDLPPANNLDGTEILYGVQNTTDVQITTDNFRTYTLSSGVDSATFVTSDGQTVIVTSGLVTGIS